MKVAPVVVAGLGGSLAMDVLQSVFARFRSRDAAGRDEETEAIVAVVKRIAPFVPFDAARTHPTAVGRAIHYLFGCGFAAAYAYARKRSPKVGVANGLPFGVGLWFLSDAVLIPAAHLGRSWWRYSWPDRANALLSHIAYGMSVEAVMRGSDT